MKTLSGVEYVRSHPERFLRKIPPSAIELAQMLAGDALILGGGKVVILRQREWYGVGSDIAWLPSENDEIVRCFAEMRPFPQAGVNSVHSEVLVGAFASGIAVWSENKILFACGPDMRDTDGMSNPFPEWACQGVMFTVSGDDFVL